jgi:protein tyrosine phosphatase (PTP) superfamily phosphohydrolase (DUF442 family)
MPTNDIYNTIVVHNRLTTGGMPTADQIRSAAVEGFTAVVNLATDHPGESLEDEAALVRSLGMAYYNIPVVWSAPQAADFTAFAALMQQLGDQKILLHCAANYRVSAFYSLYAWKHLGWTEAQALAFRQPIWDDGETYPAWQAFIDEVSLAIRNS